MSTDSLKWDGWPHVLYTQQFSARVITSIIAHAKTFEEALAANQPLPRKSKSIPRILKLLFFEPSTRTEDTFLAAGYHLGCHNRDIKHPQTFSSAAKGESFEDAIAALTRVGGMGDLRAADCIVIRHSEEGAATRAAKVVDTAAGDHKLKRPLAVINAGDGMGQHPTQAMDDIYHIYQERNSLPHPLEKITVLFSGDLKRGRTTNSLLYLLGKFGEQFAIRVIFSTNRSLSPKPELLQYLARHHITYDFMDNFPSAIKIADVIYMTRIQRERSDGHDHNAGREKFVFRKEHHSLLKPGAIVMHPLPINRDPKDPPAEIDDELTPLAMAGDPHLTWFRQSLRGIPVRAALLDLIFAGMDEHES